MKIEYPYIPKNQVIQYVSLNNPFMQAAKEMADKSGCVKQPTGAVIVLNIQIIGRGSNAGKKQNVCPHWDSPTGENYGPCKNICRQNGHAETEAILSSKYLTKDANLYLYGHWWCCRPCWEAIIKAGIRNVYLLKNSHKLFNPEINTDMKNWGKPKG